MPRSCWAGSVLNSLVASRAGGYCVTAVDPEDFPPPPNTAKPATTSATTTITTRAACHTPRRTPADPPARRAGELPRDVPGSCGLPENSGLPENGDLPERRPADDLIPGRPAPPRPLAGADCTRSHSASAGSEPAADRCHSTPDSRHAR